MGIAPGLMQKYCSHATDVIHRAIPVVTEVRPVFTHNEDFPNIVWLFGYSIRFPIQPDVNIQMNSILKMMLDYHPMVESFTHFHTEERIWYGYAAMRIPPGIKCGRRIMQYGWSIQCLLFDNGWQDRQRK